MRKWALIVSGTVTETTSIDPSGRFHHSFNWVECENEVVPGWEMKNGYLEPATEPAQQVHVPVSITPRQARLALLQSGLLASVESTIASIPGQDGEEARITWEYAEAIRRDYPLLNSVAGGLGITTEQIDAMFIAASHL